MARPENIESTPLVEQNQNLKAYCFITTEVYRQQSILANIKEIPQVYDSSIVAGTYDLVAVIHTDTPKELGEVYNEKLQHIPGVLSTTICVVLDMPSP